MGSCGIGVQRGGWEFCSEPSDLVVHLALLLQNRYTLWSLSTMLQAACTRMPPVSGNPLFVCFAPGACLYALHYLLNSCRDWKGKWIPTQAAEGPKKGTCAELEESPLEEQGLTP